MTMERYTEPSAQGIYHLAPVQVQLQLSLIHILGKMPRDTSQVSGDACLVAGLPTQRALLLKIQTLHFTL